MGAFAPLLPSSTISKDGDAITGESLYIATTLGEEHYGHYTGVAALQGFGYYMEAYVANFIPDQSLWPL